MDTFTHGLVGVAVGLSFIGKPEPGKGLGTATGVVCGVLASEAPDADRIVDYCFQPFGKDGAGLAYMLYHRGCTHTVLACVALGLLVSLPFAALANRIGFSWRRLFLI
jgi:membrane-bound metal-dependent hydrolase YbcI (DUF457 family)